MLVPDELGEPRRVGDHPLDGRVEDVRAVGADLDAGGRVNVTGGVAAEEVAAVDEGDGAPELVRDPLGDGQPEQSGADHYGVGPG